MDLQELETQSRARLLAENEELKASLNECKERLENARQAHTQACKRRDDLAGELVLECDRANKEAERARRAESNLAIVEEDLKREREAWARQTTVDHAAWSAHTKNLEGAVTNAHDAVARLMVEKRKFEDERRSANDAYATAVENMRQKEARVLALQSANAELNEQLEIVRSDRRALEELHDNMVVLIGEIVTLVVEGDDLRAGMQLQELFSSFHPIPPTSRPR